MSEHDIGQFLYLALLGAAIGGYFIVANRDRLGQVARQAALWGLIFLGVIAAAGLWPSIRGEVAPRQAVIGAEGRIEIPRGFDGHYHLTMQVEGVPVDFIVDTGASDLVLTREDAARIGRDPDRLAYLGQAMTANGTVPIARVVLDEVSLGGVSDRNVGASVNGGEMSGSLLGMSYLERFGRIEISGGKLILER